MTKFFVDDSVIIDAWLIVLHRNASEQDQRPLRCLVKDDILIIHQMRRELAELWATHKLHRKYKSVRDEYLNQKMLRDSWTDATRNLYASILSTINNWFRQSGRDSKSVAELKHIWVGAGLLLQFSDLPIQRKLNL